MKLVLSLNIMELPTRLWSKLPPHVFKIFEVPTGGELIVSSVGWRNTEESLLSKRIMPGRWSEHKLFAIENDYLRAKSPSLSIS